MCWFLVSSTQRSRRSSRGAASLTRAGGTLSTSTRRNLTSVVGGGLSRLSLFDRLQTPRLLSAPLPSPVARRACTSTRTRISLDQSSLFRVSSQLPSAKQPPLSRLCPSLFLTQGARGHDIFLLAEPNRPRIRRTTCAPRAAKGTGSLCVHSSRGVGPKGRCRFAADLGADLDADLGAGRRKGALS